MLARALTALYRVSAWPLARLLSAQAAHDTTIALLRAADAPVLAPLWAWLGAWTLPHAPVLVGGVRLPVPLVLAAGLVKGDGFASEAEALAAVAGGRNIMPGWRALPRLLGPVEFGSFTAAPRTGNPPPVLWRDVPTRSLQNRVGLRNPGAVAAATFLAAHARDLPPVWGLNVAATPGLTDAPTQAGALAEAVGAFVARGLRPAWVTMNLSCPNTDDDPRAHQTDAVARAAGAAVVAAAGGTPVWAKVGPGLAAAQYAALARAFAEVGVRAVVATNTLAAPTPDGVQTAGVSGGRLRPAAQQAARALLDACAQHRLPLDVIGCGGVQSASELASWRALGVHVVQYYSVLVYHGPFAPAVLAHEEHKGPLHD